MYRVVCGGLYLSDLADALNNETKRVAHVYGVHATFTCVGGPQFSSGSYFQLIYISLPKDII